jgi:ribonuclease HI
MTSRITVYCDGACEPRNPGGWATWAWVAYVGDKEISYGYGCVGVGAGMSNNVAEYEAVVQALRRAQHKRVSLDIYTDSQLVVRQVNGEWRVNAVHLQPRCTDAQRLLHATDSTITWIPREQNERADAFSKLAYQQARKKDQTNAR